jgi:C-terminal processing protease CtpA/Prc
MKKMLSLTAATAVVLAFAVPAFAGGEGCSHGSSASAAATHDCGGSAKSSAWSGAWLQRMPSGEITVAAVAKGSPAYRSGLETGDVVLAVNGYDLSDSEQRETCANKAECSVGHSVTYKVQRGSSTRLLKFKLEKMPANATARFSNRQAAFEPALAAVVIPTSN